jgi:A/G-specific adenine glycosylase
MMEVPTSPWVEEKAVSWPDARAFAPFRAKWVLLSGVVHHTFTHFDLELRIVEADCAVGKVGLWVGPKDWADQALPSVMRKVLAVVQEKRMKE